jgi:hypothetical protein
MLFGSPAIVPILALDPWLCAPRFPAVCLSRSLYDFQTPVIYDIKEVKTRLPGLPKEARSVSMLRFR